MTTLLLMAFASFGSVFVLSIVFPGECCSSGVKVQRNRWLTTYNWKDLHSTVQWQILDANFKIVGGLYTQPDTETNSGGSMSKCLKKMYVWRLTRTPEREIFVPNMGNEYSDKPVSVSNLLWWPERQNKTTTHWPLYVRWSLVTTDYLSIKVGPRGVISIDNTSQPLWT